MRASVQLIVALSGLASACGGTDDVCSSASAHLQTCLGFKVEVPDRCNPEMAGRVLDTECERLAGVRGTAGAWEELFFSDPWSELDADPWSWVPTDDFFRQRPCTGDDCKKNWTDCIGYVYTCSGLFSSLECYHNGIWYKEGTSRQDGAICFKGSWAN